MTAADILKLIENVSPDDTEKLDEIDARVWCWLNDRTFHGRDGKGRFAYNLHYALSMAHPRKRINKEERYTRSRDALKGIRPEGWRTRLEQETQVGKEWLCGMNRVSGAQKFRSICATEELAELHAIIQAIKHEGGGE